MNWLKNELSKFFSWESRSQLTSIESSSEGKSQRKKVVTFDGIVYCCSPRSDAENDDDSTRKNSGSAKGDGRVNSRLREDAAEEDEDEYDDYSSDEYDRGRDFIRNLSTVLEDDEDTLATDYSSWYQRSQKYQSIIRSPLSVLTRHYTVYTSSNQATAIGQASNSGTLKEAASSLTLRTSSGEVQPQHDDGLFFVSNERDIVQSPRSSTVEEDKKKERSSNEFTVLNKSSVSKDSEKLCNVSASGGMSYGKAAVSQLTVKEAKQRLLPSKSNTSSPKVGGNSNDASERKHSFHDRLHPTTDRVEKVKGDQLNFEAREDGNSGLNSQRREGNGTREGEATSSSKKISTKSATTSVASRKYGGAPNASSSSSSEEGESIKLFTVSRHGSRSVLEDDGSRMATQGKDKKQNQHEGGGVGFGLFRRKKKNNKKTKGKTNRKLPSLKIREICEL